MANSVDGSGEQMCRRAALGTGELKERHYLLRGSGKYMSFARGDTDCPKRLVPGPMRKYTDYINAVVLTIEVIRC